MSPSNHTDMKSKETFYRESIEFNDLRYFIKTITLP